MKRGPGRPKGSKNKPKLATGVKGLDEKVLRAMIQETVSKVMEGMIMETQVKLRKPRGRKPKSMK